MADRYTRAELGDGAFSKAGAKTLWDVRNVVPADELKRYVCLASPTRGDLSPAGWYGEVADQQDIAIGASGRN